jgi:hypothetical protein
MMRYLGSIVGSGMLAGLLTIEDGSEVGLATFRVLFGVVLVFALASLVAAALIRPRAYSPHGQTSPEPVAGPADAARPVAG